MEDSSRTLGAFVLATALLVAASAPAAANPKAGGLRYTVVVDKFDNRTESPRRLGDEWATLLTSALHEHGQFIVVAQDDMQLAALKEQLRGLSGVTAQGKKTAVRGQMTPAQLLIKGIITHFDEGSADQGGGIGFGGIQLKAGRKKTEIRATLQMVDASTGSLVAAKNFTGYAQGRALSVGLQHNGGQGGVNMGKGDNVHEALEKAITEVIPWLALQLSSVAWRGSVIKVDGDRVIINRGSREGVSSGDEFIVGESEVLRDPDTGEVLEEFVTERARLRADKVNERTTTCSIVQGDASQVVDGMGLQYSREGA
jgi:curli biogenesis system outer membrane secretion channel CsgG